MNIPIWKLLAVAASLLGPAAPAAAADPRPVTWTEPGHDSQDSMPLGNGDLGLNVWTQPDGIVRFYLSKTDAWSEAPRSELVKLGRVALALSPNPFAGAQDFRQTLDPLTAALTLSGGGCRVRIWIDANAPVVRVEITADQPLTATVQLEPWRTEPKGKVTADVVVPDDPAGITWYHRNAATRVDPQLADRTFGGRLFGPGLARTSLRELTSAKPARTQTLILVALTTPAGPLADWTARLNEIAATAAAQDPARAWAAHVRWWREFWDRSHIVVTGDADAERVTDGYALQRFITAASGRGAYPIKFNGSIFVTDFPGNTTKDKVTKEVIPAPMNADERAWGGQYWFQNTRPMYWPRLAAGDYDLMLPLFRMYRDMLPLNSRRVREFYGHDGAYFRETAPFWGDLGKIKPEDKGSYTQHYYLPILELSAMGLDYYDHTGDETFLRDTLLPVATAGLTFYDEHFPRDPQGRLLLEPVNSIEMFWKVRNPLPDLAALHVLLPRLLALPPDKVPPAERKRWQALLAALPPIPIGEKAGQRVLLPYEGEQTAPGHNTEVPELYAVYPFALYGAGRPDLDLARATFAARAIKRTKCWHQDPVWAASLGLAEEARRDVVVNLTNRDPRLRFPAFWEKGHDFAPDQDNGGNGELALQRMLLQTDGRRLLLLPAWPAGWSADFKLHAPGRTVVAGRVDKGRLVALDVTPAARRADVEFLGPVAPDLLPPKKP